MYEHQQQVDFMDVEASRPVEVRTEDILALETEIRIAKAELDSLLEKLPISDIVWEEVGLLTNRSSV